MTEKEKALEVRVRELEKRISRLEAAYRDINLEVDGDVLAEACGSGLSELTNHRID